MTAPSLTEALRDIERVLDDATKATQAIMATPSQGDATRVVAGGAVMSRALDAIRKIIDATSSTPTARVEQAKPALSVYVLREQPRTCDRVGYDYDETITTVIAESVEQARRAVIAERGILHPSVDELAALELVAERLAVEPGVVCECEVGS